MHYLYILLVLQNDLLEFANSHAGETNESLVISWDQNHDIWLLAARAL